MGAFQTIGRAGGGAGVEIGDVRLFAEDPGEGWLVEDEVVRVDPRLAPHLMYQDLNNWRPYNAPANTPYIAGGNGRFVMVSAGLSFVSFDGKSWQQGGASSAGSVTNNLIFTGSMFFAHGFAMREGRSVDGFTWDTTSSTGASTTSARAFAYGNDVFVGAQSASQAIMSTDSYAWTAYNVGWAASNGDCNDVAFGNGRFVIVGHGSSTRRAYTAVSTNGQAWSASTLPGAVNLNGTNSVSFVTFCKNFGAFLALTNGNVLMHSATGADWQLLDIPGRANYYGLKCDSDETTDILATGTTKFLTYSAAEGWKEREASPNGPASNTKIAYQNERFIAQGPGAKIIMATQPRLRALALPERPPSKESWKAYTRIAA